MKKKKKDENRICFLGEASDDVTGSMYLVEFEDKKILLECGLYQSSKNSYLDSYRKNSAKFGFDPASIDYVFVGHAHIDHCGLLPRLVKEGFKGEIICTTNTYSIMRFLLLNSCHILREEAETLSRTYKRNYEPLYDEGDVFAAMELVEPHDGFDSVVRLDDKVSFRYYRNSHCVGAVQTQIILTGETSKKILYTSDLGALNPVNHFVPKTEIPDEYNDVVIMESTYGDPRRCNKKTRKSDEDKIKAIVDTIQVTKGRALFPAFSFSRTQELLYTIYKLYGKDESFDLDVVIDSTLSCAITQLYQSMLDLEDMRLWRES